MAYSRRELGDSGKKAGQEVCAAHSHVSALPSALTFSLASSVRSCGSSCFSDIRWHLERCHVIRMEQAPWMAAVILKHAFENSLATAKGTLRARPSYHSDLSLFSLELWKISVAVYNKLWMAACYFALTDSINKCWFIDCSIKWLKWWSKVKLTY